MNKLFACFLGLSLCVTAPLNAEEYDFASAKAVIDSYVANGKIAGGVVLVTKDGAPVLHYASGKRDLATADPIKTDSLFRIASQTKALTSVAVMILQDQGKLDVNDKVSKYIPAYEDMTVLEEQADKSFKAVAANREITIHDLLTHSAGISYGWGPNQAEWAKADLFDWYFADLEKSMLEALSVLPTIPQAAQPGEAFVYGHNTDILGALVAKVSGMSLRDFFKKEITGPLGMLDTDFIVPMHKHSRLATVYLGTENGLEPAPNVEDAQFVNGAMNYMQNQGHYTDPNLKAYSGGAGLISTSSDYSKFLVMLENGGVVDGKRIVSEAAVAAMTKDQIPYIKMDWNDGFGYGFQLQNYDDGDHAGKVAEYGWGGAYHSTYVVRPIDNVTIVYLTQVFPTENIKDWDELRVEVLKSLDIAP